MHEPDEEFGIVEIEIIEGPLREIGHPIPLHIPLPQPVDATDLPLPAPVGDDARIPVKG